MILLGNSFLGWGVREEGFYGARRLIRSLFYFGILGGNHSVHFRIAVSSPGISTCSGRPVGGGIGGAGGDVCRDVDDVADGGIVVLLWAVGRGDCGGGAVGVVGVLVAAIAFGGGGGIDGGGAVVSVVCLVPVCARICGGGGAAGWVFCLGDPGGGGRGAAAVVGVRIVSCRCGRQSGRRGTDSGSMCGSRGRRRMRRSWGRMRCIWPFSRWYQTSEQKPVFGLWFRGTCLLPG